MVARGESAAPPTPAWVETSRYRQYIPHTIVTTFVVAVAPVWLSVWLFDWSFIPSTAFCLVLSLILGAIGTALWQRMRGCRDFVFDDLLLWRFIRRFRNDRDSAELAGRLSGVLESTELSKAHRARLLKKLAVNLEQGDPFTNGHSKRVARHADMIAKKMRLDDRFREKVVLAALLHDVGKLEIPRSILHKPGRLTEDEFEIVKTHPSSGAELVAMLEDEDLTRMVRSHHERIDGTGYPDRLSRDEIPLGARIISVADTFDAITSRRPYRSGQKHQVAIEILKKEAGSQLDGDVVKAFLAYYRGRRSLSSTSVVTNIFRSGPETAFGSLGRVLPTVANSLVIGGTSAALSLSPLRSPSGIPDVPVTAMGLRGGDREHVRPWEPEPTDPRPETDEGPPSPPAHPPTAPEPIAEVPAAPLPIADEPPTEPPSDQQPPEQDQPPAHTPPPAEEPPVAEEPPRGGAPRGGATRGGATCGGATQWRGHLQRGHLRRSHPRKSHLPRSHPRKSRLRRSHLHHPPTRSASRARAIPTAPPSSARSTRTTRTACRIQMRTPRNPPRKSHPTMMTTTATSHHLTTTTTTGTGTVTRVPAGVTRAPAVTRVQVREPAL